MKRFLVISMLFLLSLALLGCSTPRSIRMKMGVTRETWMQAVDTNPLNWVRGANQWFLTGNPDAGINEIRRLPYSAAVTTTSVVVPNFSKIKVTGDYQVQVFGTDGPNTVYVYGINDTVRMVSVQVRGDTLCIEQARKASIRVRHVIVRIGVNRLNQIMHVGRGCVEGIGLRSDNLNIFSAGPGNIYLSGDMNVRKIVKTNSGNVNVFGANTPLLDIKTSGVGLVNVSGNVGVRSIVHHGNTGVNIIGANTNSLNIYADGKGKIGIQGTVNLHLIHASGLAQVYVYQATSENLNIRAFGKAKVGVAGTARNLYIDACKQSCVLAKDFCVASAYVRTHDAAHVNISGNKIFAAATGSSSIYFYGSPDIISQFVSGNGVVVPIWTPSKFCAVAIKPVVAVPMPSYKGEGNGTYQRWKHKQQRHRFAPRRLQGEG